MEKENKENKDKNENLRNQSQFYQTNSASNNFPMMSCLTCPKCKSSIEIKFTEVIDNELKITYTCQKGHKDKKIPLTQLINASNGENEICTCEFHKKCKFLGFCNRSLCLCI